MSLVKLRRRMAPIPAKGNRQTSRVEAWVHVVGFNMAEARQRRRYRYCGMRMDRLVPKTAR